MLSAFQVGVIVIDGSFEEYSITDDIGFIVKLHISDKFKCDGI